MGETACVVPRRRMSPSVDTASAHAAQLRTVVALTHMSCASAARKRKPSDEMNSNLFFAREAREALARALGFALALASVCALAQPAQRPPNAPDAGQVLEQTRQPLRLPPPEDPVLPRPPEPKPALPVSPQLKVKVEQFTFTGYTLYPEEALQAQVQEFI